MQRERSPFATSFYDFSNSMDNLSAYAAPLAGDASMFFTPMQAAQLFYAHRVTRHCTSLRNAGNGITGAMLHLCPNRVAEADPLAIFCTTCLAADPASMSACNAEGNLGDVFSYRFIKPLVPLAPVPPPAGPQAPAQGTSLHLSNSPPGGSIVGVDPTFVRYEPKASMEKNYADIDMRIVACEDAYVFGLVGNKKQAAVATLASVLLETLTMASGRTMAQHMLGGNYKVGVHEFGPYNADWTTHPLKAKLDSLDGLTDFGHEWLLMLLPSRFQVFLPAMPTCTPDGKRLPWTAFKSRNTALLCGKWQASADSGTTTEAVYQYIHSPTYATEMSRFLAGELSSSPEVAARHVICFLALYVARRTFDKAAFTEMTGESTSLVGQLPLLANMYQWFDLTYRLIETRGQVRLSKPDDWKTVSAQAALLAIAPPDWWAKAGILVGDSEASEPPSAKRQRTAPSPSPSAASVAPDIAATIRTMVKSHTPQTAFMRLAAAHNVLNPHAVARADGYTWACDAFPKWTPGDNECQLCGPVGHGTAYCRYQTAVDTAQAAK
jgi:hypothetical protein